MMLCAGAPVNYDLNIEVRTMPWRLLRLGAPTPPDFWKCLRCTFQLPR